MMKKFGFTILCITIIVVLGIMLFDYPRDKEIEYYQEINTIVKDLDFFTARLNEGIITLYDSDFSIVDEIKFDFYHPRIPLIAIRKEHNNTFFITRGSVDDEYGIVFINDDSAFSLDGIMSLERIDGNSFIYSTR